jgi:hypothetical protein
LSYKLQVAESIRNNNINLTLKLNCERVT